MGFVELLFISKATMEIGSSMLYRKQTERNITYRPIKPNFRR